MNEQCRSRHPEHRDRCMKLAGHREEHRNPVTGRSWPNPRANAEATAERRWNDRMNFVPVGIQKL